MVIEIAAGILLAWVVIATFEYWWPVVVFIIGAAVVLLVVMGWLN